MKGWAPTTQHFYRTSYMEEMGEAGVGRASCFKRCRDDNLEWMKWRKEQT